MSCPLVGVYMLGIYGECVYGVYGGCVMVYMMGMYMVCMYMMGIYDECVYGVCGGCVYDGCVHEVCAHNWGEGEREAPYPSMCHQSPWNILVMCPRVLLMRDWGGKGGGLGI